MKQNIKKEKLNFQADVMQLLNLVTNSLYSNKEFFLRELISNSSDACEKLRYQALSKKNVLGDDTNLTIKIKVSKKRKIIEVEDNGIGMSRDEVIENLGTIAKSGTKQFFEALTGDQTKDSQLICQ